MLEYIRHLKELQVVSAMSNHIYSEEEVYSYSALNREFIIIIVIVYQRYKKINI